MNEMKLIITGATKGIGKSIALLLAARGYHLLLCARTGEDLNALHTEITVKHPDCTVEIYPADLAQRSDRERLISQISEAHTYVDVLINNAGIYLPGNLLEEDAELIEKSLRLNLLAPYYLSRSLFPLLKSSSRPQIINIGSVGGLKPLKGGGTYSITKYAMKGLSDNLRLELKEFGIKVTTIHPGYTWSDSWKGADLPRERLMEPTDVAKVVCCALDLGKSAVLEEVVLRPVMGEFD